MCMILCSCSTATVAVLIFLQCVNMQVSEFAKSNTIAEQRKLLPVYDVRDDLLQVIRENQVVVIVGETGSGKTTQVRCTPP